MSHWILFIPWYEFLGSWSLNAKLLGKNNERRSLAPSKIRTHDLRIIGRVLYHCAIATTSYKMLIIQDPFGIFKRSLFWFKIAFFPLGSFLPFWPFRLLGPRWGSRPKGTSVFGAIFLLSPSKNFNSFKKTFGVRAVRTGSRFLLPLKSCWWRHLTKWWRHHWQKRKFIN